MFFKKLDFEIDFFLVSEIGWKNYHVTDFEMKISLRVSFQVKAYNASGFEVWKLQHVWLSTEQITTRQFLS